MINDYKKYIGYAYKTARQGDFKSAYSLLDYARIFDKNGELEEKIKKTEQKIQAMEKNKEEKWLNKK